MTTTQKTPLNIILLYAIGQFGWSLATYSVSNLLNYFYLPPETNAAPLFPAYIYQGSVLGIATILGLIGFSGRFVDALIDPLVAAWSDRTQSPLGRRRKFMLWGFVPLSLFAFLVFMPPIPYESVWNAVWLVVTLYAFYFSMSIYVTPYTALISELAADSDQSLFISLVVSVTWALGFGLGNQIYVLQDYWLGYGYTVVQSFQLTIFLFSLFSLILMGLPSIFLNEARYCSQHATQKNAEESIRSVLQNANFRFFALSDLMYWLALTFIQMGMSYYLTVLLKMPSASVSGLLTLMLGLSFVFYAPVNLLAKKIGKKHLMMLSFWAFAFIFFIISLLGKIPLSANAQALIIGLLASIPVAVFSILPNAVVADIIRKDAQLTGDHKAGQFYAVRTFTMKVGVSLANFVFPSLLLLGKSTENDFGIRLTGITAAFFCMMGFFVFRKYKDDM